MASKLQAFIDESASSDELVLAGYIQTAEVWANFASDWEKALPFGTRAKNGKFHFHMTEMNYAGKMADVEKFSSVIDRYDLLAVSFRMNLTRFRDAIAIVERRFLQQGIEIDWERWSDPYYFGFRHFLEQFHHHRHLIEQDFPLTDKIDFYFDRRSESIPILKAWSEVRENRSAEDQEQYGDDPRFENSQEFLGLQAADFWSWWVRKWYEEDDTDVPAKLEKLDFGGWRGRRRPRFTTSVSEEYIIDALTLMTIENLPKRRGF